MSKRLLPILFVVVSLSIRAQVDSTTKSSSVNDEQLPPEIGEVFKPTFGLGTGMLSFWGDLNGGKIQSPWNSRVAYEMNISQPLNKILFLDFYVMFGKLGFNERAATRNENFESEIRLGGVNLLYDFSNFISNKHLRVRPWISTGFEAFEYLSKTDLYDRYGRKYYYWNDGSIKNMAEGAPGAQNAVDLVRDYKYESDIRELNKDGYGKYAERSWAVPLGIGFMYRINKRIDFKMGTTLHMTFTDYLDGITAKGKEVRAGNKANDNFIMSSFSIQYDLVLKDEEKSEFKNVNYDNVDFMAIDLEDEDGDGVNDFLDESHKTPLGVEVDEKGRPLDADGDWIPDYRDDEKSTPSNVLANPQGVALTENMTKEWEDKYYDSTGLFSKVVNVDSLAMVARGIKVKSLDQKYYTVELGRFKGGIPSFVMEYLLSVNDVSSLEEGDSVIMYNAGSYEDIGQALKRKKEFVAAGVEDAKIAYFLRHHYVVLTDEEAMSEYKSQMAALNQSTKEDSIRLAELYPATKTEVKPESIAQQQTTSPSQPVVNNNPVKDTSPIQNTPKDNIPKETNPVAVLTPIVKEAVTATDVAAPPSDNPNQPIKEALPDVGVNPAGAQVNQPKDSINPVVTNPATGPVQNIDITSNPIVKQGEQAVAAQTPKEITPEPVKLENASVKQTEAPAIVTPTVANTATASEAKGDFEGIVYRVQLGAYRNKLSPSMFKTAGKIVELKTEDGYYKYTTVGYRSIKDAAKHRAELLEDGYPDAFISAYKDGKRISLAKAGAAFVNVKDAKNENLDEQKVVNAVDKSLISYKVQLGVVRTEGSDPEFSEKIKKMTTVEKQTTITGLIRYTVGDVRTYNEAMKIKNNLLKQGFADAFIIATFKGELISIQEANALSK